MKRCSAPSRVATFARSMLTGGIATLADFAVIAFVVGVLGLSPQIANVPALLAGAAVQFIGNRHFAFHDARAGSLRRQLALFAAAELVGLGLNGALYFAVATTLPRSVAAAVLARAVTTNIVFLGWSYPVWSRVFRPGDERAA